MFRLQTTTGWIEQLISIIIPRLMMIVLLIEELSGTCVACADHLLSDSWSCGLLWSAEAMLWDRKTRLVIRESVRFEWIQNGRAFHSRAIWGQAGKEIRCHLRELRWNTHELPLLVECSRGGAFVSPPGTKRAGVGGRHPGSGTIRLSEEAGLLQKI